MVFLRAIALVVGIAITFAVGASRVPNQVKLQVAGVVPGAIITQPFGCTTLELEPAAYWCPFHHFHSGVDLAAPQGTEIYSATSGRVYIVGYDAAGPGLYVLVQVDQHVQILYCHLANAKVKPGDQLQAGQLIGTVGASGLATGPHLHFEVQIDRVPVDPGLWLGS